MGDSFGYISPLWLALRRFRLCCGQLGSLAGLLASWIRGQGSRRGPFCIMKLCSDFDVVTTGILTEGALIQIAQALVLLVRDRKPWQVDSSNSVSEQGKGSILPWL